MSNTFAYKARRILGHNVTIALLIFAVALALRLVYVTSTVIDKPIRADAAKYAAIAINLVRNETYTHLKSETPDAFITPGYPLFLTAFFAATQDIAKTYSLVLYTQALLMALAAAIVFLLCMQFLPRWAALSAGVLMVFAPHMVTISGYMLTEAIFTLIVCLSIYLLVLGTKKESLALLLAGAFFIGIGALVRPSYLFFPVVVAAVILLDKRLLASRRLIFASLTLIVVAVVWSPWTIWKSDKESSVDTAAASFALGSYPDLIHDNPHNRGFPYRDDPQFEAMSNDMDVSLDVAFGRAQQDPGKYIYWYLIGKPTTYWNWSILVAGEGPFIYRVRSSIYSEYGFFEYTLSLFRAIHPILILLSLLAAVTLLRNLFRSRFDTAPFIEAYLIFGCIAYFTAVHMVFAPLPRYSIPMHPLIYITGLYSITKLLELKKQTSQE
jgi:4-amino-4-deoxy-L-arabinose transferase-like glycosyltransferase